MIRGLFKDKGLNVGTAIALSIGMTETMTTKGAETMTTTANKTDKRAAWIIEHNDDLIAARLATSDHTDCKGNCLNGRTCKTQSTGGWGYWVWAFVAGGVDCDALPFWSGSAPTPSTSINRGMADYISVNAPKNLT